MSNEMMKKEVKEVIRAGEQALFSLQCAQGKLKSAANWGLLDVFGGNFITGMAKHSKIQEASKYLEMAKMDLEAFQDELKDVNHVFNLELEIGQFLSFADFFLDGFIVDYIVQSKIAEVKNEVDQVIVQTEGVLKKLKLMDV